MLLPVTQRYILLIGKQYLQNRNNERNSLKLKILSENKDYPVSYIAVVESTNFQID